MKCIIQWSEHEEASEHVHLQIDVIDTAGLSGFLGWIHYSQAWTCSYRKLEAEFSDTSLLLESIFLIARYFGSLLKTYYFFLLEVLEVEQNLS